jgi:Txe/YoeB family toxin of Txe-Axe toxin-antitoxin module
VRLEFRERAFEDLQYWVQMNPKVAKRLLRLIEDAFPGPRLIPEGRTADTEALFALCDDVWVRRGYAVLSDAASSPAQLAAAFADVASPRRWSMPSRPSRAWRAPRWLCAAQTACVL